MRKVFIDLGVMDGRSLKFFYENHPEGPEFYYYGFECMPRNLVDLPSKLFSYSRDLMEKVIIVPKAAWTYRGHVRFYTGKLDGSSVRPDKTTGRINHENYTDVECLDLADFIRSRFSPEDEIIIKMNVEGAEYQLIRHLHSNGLIPWINKWYVCWHQHKLSDMPISEHEEVQSLLPKWFPWHPGGPNSVELFSESLKESSC